MMRPDKSGRGKGPMAASCEKSNKPDVCSVACSAGAKELLAVLHGVSACCVLECPYLWKYQYLCCSMSQTEGSCQPFKSFDSLQIFG